MLPNANWLFLNFCSIHLEKNELFTNLDNLELNKLFACQIGTKQVGSKQVIHQIGNERVICQIGNE